MAPLIVLVVVTLIARLAGQLGATPLRDWAAATRLGLAVMFCFTAAAHFNSMRSDMVRMVPPAVPNPELMVTLTGICEVLGAIGLLVPRTRRIAAVALIVFLIAVLPANIHAAQSGVTFRGAADTARSARRPSAALHSPCLVVRAPCTQRHDVAGKPERRRRSTSLTTRQVPGHEIEARMSTPKITPPAGGCGAIAIRQTRRTQTAR